MLVTPLIALSLELLLVSNKDVFFIYRQSLVKNTYKKLQVNTTIYFCKVHNNKAGNLDKTKVLSFPKGKIELQMGINEEAQIN